MEFDYFYHRDSERFIFYMLPKVLLSHEFYKNLSSDAKILYSCLLERTSLSFKNNWIDEEKRIYIIFPIEEVMEVLNKSNKTAVKIFAELDKETGGIGLLERRRQGLGKPNIIYVKDFMSVFRDESLVECKNYTSEVKELHSGSVNITLQEVKKAHGSNTNINNPDYSEPDISFRGEQKQKKYGTFQNVYLTDEDIKELEEKIGSKVTNYIERLGAYMRSTGKTYKNHKMAILTWFFKDEGSNQKKSNVPTIEEYKRGDYL